MHHAWCSFTGTALVNELRTLNILHREYDLLIFFLFLFKCKLHYKFAARSTAVTAGWMQIFTQLACLAILKIVHNITQPPLQTTTTTTTTTIYPPKHFKWTKPCVILTGCTGNCTLRRVAIGIVGRFKVANWSPGSVSIRSHRSVNGNMGTDAHPTSIVCIGHPSTASAPPIIIVYIGFGTAAPSSSSYIVDGVPFALIVATSQRNVSVVCVRGISSCTTTTTTIWNRNR